jgi:uncharacterized cofD-like protein
MTDSGGSNCVLRDEFGLLPTSDIRQCITALAQESKTSLLRKLFTYRYSNGTGISGMTFGNLFMAALTEILGSQSEAIQATCQMLNVKGEIIPVTFDNTHLVARYDNGKQVLGEHFIDEPDSKIGHHKIVELDTFPKAQANPKAVSAIKSADAIILGPGDLFTSTICNLVIDGIPQAIAKSKAKKIFITNVMTKFGQTNHFTTQDHLNTLEQYLKPNTINYCLVNHPAVFPKSILKRYQQESAYPVHNNLKSTKTLTVITKNFVKNELVAPHKSDHLKRSLIRHDSAKIASTIYKIISHTA